MAGVCQIVPLVDGKPSKLYEGLYEYTKHDKPLTNILYAVSLIQKKTKLTKQNTNSQGEMELDAFIQMNNVEAIIDSKAKIDQKLKQLDAVDKNGEYNVFIDPSEIRDRVIEFNENNPDFSAFIVYSTEQEGFEIHVGVKTAENYRTNTELEERDAQWSVIISNLKDGGLDTQFSDNSISFFNFFNVYRVRSLIADLNNNKFNTFFDIPTANFIKETMKQHPLYQRLKERFGDNFVNALITRSYSLSSTDAYQHPSTKIEMTKHDNELVDRFISAFRDKLAQVDISYMFEEADKAKDKVQLAMENNATVNEIPEATVREVLNKLYKNYHIDQDLLSSAENSIKSTSDIAKISQKRNAIRLHKLQKDRTITRKEKERMLYIMNQHIENGRYLESTAYFLKSIANEIRDAVKIFKKLEKKYRDEKDDYGVSMKELNLLCESINKIQNALGGNIDILNTLASIDSNSDLIKVDNDNTSNEIRVYLFDAVRELKAFYDNFLNVKQIIEPNIVYAFLKDKWGKDKSLLRDLIKTAQTDISVMDTWILSIMETSNPLLNAFGDQIYSTHVQRDNRLNDIAIEIRRISNKLGGRTKFMYVLDNEKVPTGKIISPYRWDVYEKELKEYKDQLTKQKLSDKAYNKAVSEWVNEHTKEVELGADLGFTDLLAEFKKDRLTMIVPNSDKYSQYDNSGFMQNLTADEKEYYRRMMHLKAELTKEIPELVDNFYDAIQLSSNFINSIGNAGFDPAKMFKQLGQKIGDIYKTRVDDTEYGMLATNGGIKEELVDQNGKAIYRLPIFFTHQLEDPSKMSTDFSRGMLAMASSIVNYTEMSKIFDALTLTKTFLQNKKVAKSQGSSIVGSTIQITADALQFQPSLQVSQTSNTARLLESVFQSSVLGARKQPANVGKVSIDKISDSITRYTSVVGLSTNVLGAQANLLVGKIQMLIETGFGMGGEFFGVKNLTKASGQYWALLPKALAEFASNNKKAKLNLLMDLFNVTSDFYQKVKEDSFNSNILAKVMSNSSMFMLYGGGEHLLHAQTMLAILDRKKVLDPKGRKVSLYDALDVKVVEGNGEIIVKEGYKTLEGEEIDLKAEKGLIDRTRREIKYCNDSMHGAFGEDDKGMIHRYFVGRLIMNFRQWMPAHYERRFGRRHYNATLQEDREGFYTSTAKFIWQLAKDAKDMKFQWGTRWNSMSDMERFNCKRCASECLILGLAYALIVLAGDYKDHKNNWARRNLIYQLRRIELEIGATNPLILPSSKFFGGDNESYNGKSWSSPVHNTITLLNSPIAATNTLNTFVDLVSFGKMTEYYEDGKFKGENKYLHTLEKDLPLYGKIKQQFIDFQEENGMFQYMDN